MKKKITSLKVDVLMPTTSQYHVLHHFARKLYEAFERTGMKCRRLEGEDRYLSMKLRPDFTVGFNGALKMKDGTFFCDHIEIPHIACLVDPPFRFPALANSPNILITCDDQVGSQLLRKKGFEKAFFMPHAVEKDLRPGRAVERIYDIVFLATSIDFEARRKKWHKDYPKKVWTLMEEAAEVALEDDAISFMSVLEQKLSPWENQTIYEEVELYIKGKDRLNLVNSITDYTIHVFGGSADKSDWSKLLKGKKNVVVHPSVEYEEAMKIMQQSKIVLNSSIKNKLGAHERIFTASACGAVVVTNENTYVNQFFKNGRDMLLYPCNGFEKLNEDIHGLLQDPEECRAVAAAGRKVVMKEHTWDNRVQTLYDLLEGL